MSEIQDHLGEVLRNIKKASADSGKASLIAVSKTFPSTDIRVAYDAGQRLFGESKLQEAEPKIQDLPSDIEWHFIGRVQRNKVRKILPLFSVIHAVDSLKLAAYVDKVAGELARKPKVFLQINQAEEDSKGGFSPGEIFDHLDELLALSNLEIMGLMTIPPADDDRERTRSWFRKLKATANDFREKSGLALPWLSMGMSGDYQTAVEEGATHVRVGSAIFGKRDYQVEGELGS